MKEADITKKTGAIELNVLGVMIKVGEGAVVCSILNIYVLGKSDESKRLPLWQL